MTGADDRDTGANGETRQPRYRFATRLNSFASVAESGSGAALVRAAARVRGLSAVELNFPQHVRTQPRADLDAAIAESGLTPTGLNLRFGGAEFADGAFTNPRAATRQRAVRIVLEAVEEAGRFGIDHVVVWLAEDGFDYPFQVDQGRVRHDAVEAFGLVAGYDPAIRIGIEPKPSDPRRFSLVRGVPDALLICRDVGLPNLGVTLDVCHALMVGEYPAASAALALGEGRLFGVHLNDGYGRADDGLAVGSVNPMATLDLLRTLRSGGYGGTLYFDTFPIREDPVAECEANIRTVLRLEAALDRLDEAGLARAQANHDALAATAIVEAALNTASDGEAR